VWAGIRNCSIKLYNNQFHFKMHGPYHIKIVQCCVVGWFGAGAGRKDWWQALSFIRNALCCALLKLFAFAFVSTPRLGYLGIIFGPKSDEVTGEWRKLHNEELMIRTPHSKLFR
jgi:hypothetical protein